MNRKGNSRHNAYLSSLPLFLLPTPLWHPFFSSFLFSLAETVWLLWFLSHGQMARSGVPPAQTQNKIKPQILHLPCTNIFFFLKFLLITDALFVCQVFFVNHGNQASPFSHLVSLFQKRSLSLAKTSLWIQAHLKTKGETVYFCRLVSFKRR